jgi:hypothetical protein
MGDSNSDGDGGGEDGDGSWEIPRPGRVPEQRILSLEIGLRWWQRCGTFCAWTPIDLGFSPLREYIGGRAMSGGGTGAHTTWRCGQGVARATLWCGRLLVRLHLSSGLSLTFR